MNMSRLQDDLLQDFREQKELVDNQLELLGPLEARLHKRAATRLLGKGWLIFMEAVCYTMAGAMIALAVLKSKIYPLSVWEDMRGWVSVAMEGAMRDEVDSVSTKVNMDNFEIVLTALFGLTALLFLIIGRNLSSVRRKNDIIHNVSKDLKILVGQLLTRKAAIQSIESRHFMEDSFKDDKPMKQNVNEIPNPGYDGA